MERIQKFISECGVTSRRKAEELIETGKVKVNGEVINLGCKVEGTEIIEVDGEVITKKEDKVYFILFKPSNTISAASDDRHRTTVVDLINTDKKIFPIGRLDYDTTGLLILTNDGELSNKLTHPSGEVEKEYYVTIIGILKVDDLRKLEKGVILDGVKTKKAKVKLKKYDKRTNRSFVSIIITEGRNHEVKNMFGALGYRVVKLKRVKYSFLTLEGLSAGEYRPLTIKEVKKLYNEVK